LKILICFGTRPEAIKMAPIIQELERKKIPYTICVTAQHREMLDQVLEFFEIIPDYDLNIMQPGQSLNSLSSFILGKVDKVLEEVKPDLVLVQGDTTTAFISALAAFNRNIKIGHIEAGLRTYDKQAPFPEEGNRQLISRIADFHFAPTTTAKSNLLKEQISANNIFLTGNTVVDALRWGMNKVGSWQENKGIKKIKEILDGDKKLILVTGHRRENFGKGLVEFCDALLEIAKKKNVQLLFPVHLNPQVKHVVYKRLSAQLNIILTEPVDYPTMLWLMDKCDLVITDSGGIQEEAPSFKKPVLVTRDITERMEGVEAGFCVLTGTCKSKIVDEVDRILNNPPDFYKVQNPYGDGQAAKKIVEILTEAG